MSQMRCMSYRNDGSEIISTTFTLKKKSIIFFLDNEKITEEKLENLSIVWGINLKDLNPIEKYNLIILRFGLKPK